MITVFSILCSLLVLDCALLVLFAFDKITARTLDLWLACLNIGVPFVGLIALVVIA